MPSKAPEFEFLISTMNRTGLSFLEPMFKHLNGQDFNVLIINQTTKDKLLHSELANVRVINDFERHLTRSRNLAIENCIGKICLIADDDVEYLPDTLETVKKAYMDFSDAALISFQYIRENNKTCKIYKENSGYQHDLLHKQNLSSIEISFKPSLLKAKNIKFNLLFGIGAVFSSCEEQVLRDDIAKAGLKIAYVPKPIVKHFGETSTAGENSKAYTKAIVAQKYLNHKNLIYIWLLRYILVLWKRKVIRSTQVKEFWKYGIEAVKDYKKHMAIQDQ
jgi:glycosyltransferase involved in cell wall biosynthesis